jgi:hypothetical protein
MMAHLRQDMPSEADMLCITLWGRRMSDSAMLPSLAPLAMMLPS